MAKNKRRKARPKPVTKARELTADELKEEIKKEAFRQGFEAGKDFAASNQKREEPLPPTQLAQAEARFAEGRRTEARLAFDLANQRATNRRLYADVQSYAEATGT